MASINKRSTIVLGLVAALVLAVAGTAWAMGRGNTLELEVAEDPARFVFAGDHLIEEGDLAGFPAYGDSFVTQGWIYPEGTLDGSDGVICDTDEEGIPVSCQPEFPDEVIGEWTCYGVHIGEGAATTAGPWVVSTQIFDLGDPTVAGDSTIVTSGFETPEATPILRSVTGGTGQYAKARGEQEQTFLGFGEVFNVRMSNVIHTR